MPTDRQLDIFNGTLLCILKGVIVAFGMELEEAMLSELRTCKTTTGWVYSYIELSI